MNADDPGPLLVRATALYLPIVIAAIAVLYRRPTRRVITAAILATAWNLPALLALNVVAERLGWWTFGVEVGTIGGVPVDLWLGWALLWGAVPVLVAPTRLVLVVPALVVADLALMPLADPVLSLGSSWLVGEAVGVLACLLPGLVLGHWTARRKNVFGRASLQLIAFAGILYLVLPTLIFEVTGEGWAALLDRPRWQFVAAGLLLAPVAAMAVQAVNEFARHGGTPFPLDPPTALVTTGPYAYVANPMQLGGSVLLASWGVLLQSTSVVVASVAAGLFSLGFAAWNENSELDSRFGQNWRHYRSRVRPWIPRFRPAVVHPAVVYVAGTCEPCSEVGGFLASRPHPGLDLVPAEEFRGEIRRLTYWQEDKSETGIAAIGRSLEHSNVLWAFGSWTARLPGVQQLVQLIADAAGGDPRSIGQVSNSASKNEHGRAAAGDRDG